MWNPFEFFRPIDWLAFVYTPLMVLAIVAAAVVISGIAARRHDAHMETQRKSEHPKLY